MCHRAASLLIELRRVGIPYSSSIGHFFAPNSELPFFTYHPLLSLPPYSFSVPSLCLFSVAMTRAKGRSKKSKDATAGTLKKAQQNNTNHQTNKSRKRSRSVDRGGDGSHGGGGGSHKKKAKYSHQPTSAHHKFLTEEENLLTYYPFPSPLLSAPSPAFFARLHDELLSYANSHVPSPSMTSSRWRIIHSVRDVGRELWGPQIEAVPFGSFVTGLYIGSSDIDLDMLHVETSKAQSSQMLNKLGARLRKLGLAKDVTIIPTARVPILKFVDPTTEIPVDVALGISDGVASAALMKKQVDCYPAFRPLTLFLKAFMQSMGLADVFKGGVSSYILQVMILFHIQVQDSIHQATVAADASKQLSSSPSASTIINPSHSPLTYSSTWDPNSAIPNGMNLGYLLFSFFELFGCTFNYEEHGIRIHDLKSNTPNGPGSRLECYSKSGMGRLNRDRPYLLSIEDPIQGRDIGANCFGIRRIQRCFAQARQFLCTQPQENNQADATRKSRNSTSTNSASAASSSSSSPPGFIIDTVGDRNNGNSTATSSSSSALLSSPPVDPHSTSFNSSFGFILSALLTLPVRFSIAELQRAALVRPSWNEIIDKMLRLDHIQSKREAKLARRNERTSANTTLTTKPSDTTIDLTSLDDIILPEPTQSKGLTDTPTSAGASDWSDDGDSDVEIIEGRPLKPIPIDDMTSGGEGADEDEGEDDEDNDEDGNENNDSDANGDEHGDEDESDNEVAPPTNESATVAGVTAPAVDDDSVPIDGDALLDSPNDDSMELNLA